MNQFKPKKMGNLLIWLGSLLFLVVIYDAIRPFPSSSLPYRLEKKIAGFLPQKAPPPSSNLISVRDLQNKPRGARITVKCQGEALTDSVIRPLLIQDLWIWQVKPALKIGETVRVEAAHAAAGDRGGFSIIAFSDNDDNGHPDTEIARSAYLTSEEAGKWSGFTFRSSARRIFIGTTWPLSKDTLIYRMNGPWPEKDIPLEHIFYSSKKGGKFHRAGPAYTNMRVSFPDR